MGDPDSVAKLLTAANGPNGSKILNTSCVCVSSFWHIDVLEAVVSGHGGNLRPLPIAGPLLHGVADLGDSGVK